MRKLFRYFQRALAGLGLSVGGPAPSKCHRKSPPAHVPAVAHCGSQVPRNAVRQIAFADHTKAGPFCSALFSRQATERTARSIENFDPVHAVAILTVAYLKRNGPFVPVDAGGKIKWA